MESADRDESRYNVNFQQALCPSSAEEEDSSADEGHSVDYFHRHLSTPAMSTDSGQVGVALFSSC